VGGDAFEHVALGVGRDFDGGESLPAIDCGARFGKCQSANHDTQCAACVQRLDDLSAEIAQIIIDDRDGKLAKDLVQIGLRIINAVDQGSQEQQGEGAPRSEHAPPLRLEGTADAAWRFLGFGLLSRSLMVLGKRRLMPYTVRSICGVGLKSSPLRTKRFLRF